MFCLVDTTVHRFCLDQTVGDASSYGEYMHYMEVQCVMKVKIGLIFFFRDIEYNYDDDPYSLAACPVRCRRRASIDGQKQKKAAKQPDVTPNLWHRPTSHFLPDLFHESERGASNSGCGTLLRFRFSLQMSGSGESERMRTEQ